MTTTGSMRTVLGDVPVAELTGALTHEHVAAQLPGRERGTYLSGGESDDRLELAVRALAPLTAAGINTVVNLSGATHLGQDWTWGFLREVAHATGLHIVAGFGYYTERTWSPGVAALSLDGLVEGFVDAAAGIAGGEVRAGAYGEVATGYQAISAGEERCLRAAAIAHRETGIPIMTHASLGTMVPEQVEILARAGADLEQVVIGHVDLDPDLDRLESVLRRGVTVAFDTLGKEHFDYVLSAHEAPEPGATFTRAWTCTDAARLDALVELIRRGWAGQIVMSTDMLGTEAFVNPETHGRWGYAFLPARILPELRRRGIDGDTIRRITAENPRGLLRVRR